MNHTPGPWILRACSTNCNSGRRTLYVMNSLPDIDGKCVANVIAGPTSNPAWDANACLIAAAPDMLAACKELLAEVEHAIRQAGYDPDNRESITQARAAIAKAEGRTP